MVNPTASQNSDLARRRCYNHARREAAACCPECGRFFCRECVTEHEQRVLCARCLHQSGEVNRAKTLRWGRLVRIGHFLAGTLMLWVLFYYFGRMLLSVPTAFHEGTLWQSGWWGGR